VVLPPFESVSNGWLRHSGLVTTENPLFLCSVSFVITKDTLPRAPFDQLDKNRIRSNSQKYSHHGRRQSQSFRRFLCAGLLHVQLEKYHEQAQLLDPLLASLVIPLSAVLRREANAASAPDLAAVQTASRFLWALITVRCPQENIILVTLDTWCKI
jgi:hypothetical protein